MKKMATKRLGRFWWIVGDLDWLPCGPYDTKAEADEDRRGLEKTLEHSDNRSWFTSCRAEE